MLSCKDVARCLLYAADDGALLDDASRGALNDHILLCPECRRELDDQAAVAALLRTRPPDVPSPEFSEALGARLDRARGWLGLADWRRWTFRLLPGACILVVAAFLWPSHTNTTLKGTPSFGAPITSSSPLPDAILGQFGAPADTVVEAMLTGREPRGGH